MKQVNSYMNLMDDNKIKLDGSESSVSLDSNLLVYVKSRLPKVSLNSYPDDDNIRLRELYAKYCNEVVNANNILVGNGASELIYMVISSIISGSKKALVFDKEYDIYEKAIEVNEGEIVKYNTEKDGSFDVDKFIQFAKSEDVDLIIFSNPNNPTGYVVDIDDIRKILIAFRDKHVVIDEAYYEFCGKSAIGEVKRFNNLLVIRSLSEGLGLAAIRIGFLIANENKIDEFRNKKIVHSVNSISKIIGEFALENYKKIMSEVKNVVSERENLYEKLKNIEEKAALEIEFFKSNANYILGRTPYKEALYKGLINYGVVIKDLQGEYFRISVGSSLKNNRLLDALKEVFIYGGE